MLQKDPASISKMFDDISPTYDTLNHLMSGGRDIAWRKKAVKLLKNRNSAYIVILDLASGTGDFAAELTALNPTIICSTDFSFKMLQINRSKQIKNNFCINADAEFLPYNDDTFDLVTISFGVRNFMRINKCINEIYRVLKPNGTLVIIEMFSSGNKTFYDKFFNIYFNTIVPIFGGLISRNRKAYNYLHKSVESFFSVDEFTDIVTQEGFGILIKNRNFLNIVHTLIFNKTL